MALAVLSQAAPDKVRFYLAPPADSGAASCNHCGCILGEGLAPQAEKAFHQQHSTSSPSPSAEARRLGTEYAGGAKGRLLRARRDFEDGVGAYMREDAEVRTECGGSVRAVWRSATAV